jgi:TPR repeat protein
MGLEAQKDDASARLIAAGRSMLAAGNSKFPLTRLCAEAGVSLEDFRRNFASKAELLQQLMATTPKPEPAPADAWLERRLRVFERALSTLEERAETREREQRLALSRLEERLATLRAPEPERRLATRGEKDVALSAEVILEKPTEVPAKESVEALGHSLPVEEIERQPDAAVTRAVPSPLLLAPLEAEPVSRIDPDLLEAARQAALAHGRTLEKSPPRRLSVHWLTIALMAAFTLFICAALTLIHAAPVLPQSAAQSTAHRAIALTPLSRLTARADSGDAQAQTALALAYLRGEGVAKDETAAARWADAAARRGDPEAQYLAGSLARSDPARAFTWYQRGAAMGNVKAMHNLAIAYAQGQGTPKDATLAVQWFARAAALGYIDSAFDLGVIYESGQGVKQDARAALHWYDVAAAAGDAEAAARARFLKTEAHI